MDISAVYETLKALPQFIETRLLDREDKAPASSKGLLNVWTGCFVTLEIGWETTKEGGWFKDAEGHYAPTGRLNLLFQRGYVSYDSSMYGHSVFIEGADVVKFVEAMQLQAATKVSAASI